MRVDKVGKVEKVTREAMVKAPRTTVTYSR